MHNNNVLVFEEHYFYIPLCKQSNSLFWYLKEFPIRLLLHRTSPFSLLSLNVILVMYNVKFWFVS